MKHILLPAALFIFSFIPASAITDADIAPAALVGKTLTFTIVNGGSPYATNGTWSGTFAASGNAFTAAKITGDFVNISTTYTASVNGTFTDVALAKFVEGQAPATLTLYTQDGIGKYEAFINEVMGVSLNGTFTIGTVVPPKGPEISILQGKSGELTDGSMSRKNIGTARVGKSISKTFTIKNTGTATLKNIAISVDGKNKKEFTVTGLGKTSVAKNTTTSFIVTFKPKSIGVRNAAIHIMSNDKNENPFDIKLTGTGAGIK